MEWPSGSSTRAASRATPERQSTSVPKTSKNRALAGMLQSCALSEGAGLEQTTAAPSSREGSELVAALEPGPFQTPAFETVRLEAGTGSITERQYCPLAHTSA